MLNEEILKIIRRRQFQIVFSILFFSAIFDFLVTCKNYYGVEISWVRSAYQCGLLKSDVPLFTKQFFTTLFPILVSVAASDVYYEEQKMGINNFICTRTKKIKNIRIKILSISIVVFFMIFIPMIVNFGLSFTAFPVQAYYSSNTTYLTLTTPEPDRILSYLEAYYPYMNILIYILIRCMIGISIALFSFSVSLLNRFNQYIVLFSGMIFYILYTSITTMSASEMVRTNIFGINTYGSIWMIFVYIFVSLAISAGLIKIGSEKEIL